MNKLFMSLRSETARTEFLADERAYCARFSLSEEQTAAVLARDWQAMLDLGGSIFYIYKLAMMDGLSMQYLGGVFTGMSEADFKAALLAGGRTDV
jgi:protocatechuate 4,5-dioxygenase alpha chain